MRRPWLAPLVPLYRAGLGWREMRLAQGWEPVRRLQWPVISIGNLSTGGSGKTPLAIALAQLLKSRGLHVDVLSRGYGRSSQDASRVDPNGTAEQFGDEPLLIARAADVPVYVAPQRYDAGAIAESEVGEGSKNRAGAKRDSAGQHDFAEGAITRAHVHILDDGFQHRQLARDIDILLLSREDWHDSLLPAGNLRETLRAAERANVIAIPAEDSSLESDLRRWGWSGPVWRLRRCMDVPHLDGPVFAFCGIARPDQFFTGLQHAGVQIADRKAFADHYDFTNHVVEWLIAQAKSAGARALMTTEKDAIRLGPRVSSFSPEMPLMTAALHIEIEESANVIDWLLAQLATRIASSRL